MVLQIAVLGSDDNREEKVDSSILILSKEVGSEIAKRGAIVICGGRGGVMNAVAKGAFEEGGITVGILPSASRDEANGHLTIVIPSGLGPIMRGSLIIRAADAIISIGGGVGTLSEIATAYAYRKPIVALRKTGGWTDRLADSYIDDRQLLRIVGVDSPKEAVDMALKLARP